MTSIFSKVGQDDGRKRTTRFDVEPEQAAHRLEEIPTALIDETDNPRNSFSGIDELAESIRSVGLLEPIVVRKLGLRYELIAGARRLRAIKNLKSKTILARILIAEDLDPEKFPEARLVENIQREDLSDYEVSQALSTLKNGTGATNRELGEKLGKSEDWIKRMLRHAEIIRTSGLPVNAPNLREIPSTFTHELASLPDPERSQKIRELSSTPKELWPTVKQIRTWASERRPNAQTTKVSAKPKAGSLSSLRDRLNALKSEVHTLELRIKKKKRNIADIQILINQRIKA